MARQPPVGEQGIVRTLGPRLMALVFAVALVALLAYYPPGPVWAGAALAAYAVVLWIKPVSWLLVVPGLLPVLDFSAWTGWFYVREGDFLILATLAVGYWKLVPQRSSHRLPPAAVVLLALLACSHAISTYLGLKGFPPIDPNSFASYQTPYNSLRAVLGFAWALLLVPLLARSLGDQEINLRRYFFPGMMIGLGLAGLTVLWERVAFTGLMDFASDYRATGSFSDMHIGGAALDGYLMLALPFAAVWALQSRSLAGIATASSVFMLGTYAMLVTFSRATYVGYAVALICVLLFFQWTNRSGETRSLGRWIAAAVALALLAYVLVRVFATGGYRTLAAALGMFTAAFATGVLGLRDVSLRVAAVSVTLLGAVMVALIAWWGKSIYFSYAVALMLLGVGLVLWHYGDRKRGGSLAIASFPLLALGTVLVAWYWGGTAAVPDAFLAALIAMCLVGYNRFASRPLWSASKSDVAGAILAALALALTVPVMGNPYIKGRFGAVTSDFAGRSSHWRDGLAMIDPDWVTGAFGMGLGSFPRTYFWRNSKGEIPGVQLYRDDAANTLLRLGGPRYEIGYGDVLRVFQTIDLAPHGAYRLSLQARSNSKNAVLTVNICEKWLLYPAACVQEPLHIAVEKDEWTRFEKKVNSRDLGAAHWFGSRPVHLSIATGRAATFVEVDNVVLLDAAGRNLIRNGEFSQGHAWWYFSSDRHHLPWHAKNMLLHLLFEQGWLGFALVTLTLLYALFEFGGRALRGDPMAVAPLAALAGFLVVGLFDSLLNVSRLALLFYLLLFLSLLRAARNQRAASHIPSTVPATSNVTSVREAKRPGTKD